MTDSLSTPMQSRNKSGRTQSHRDLLRAQLEHEQNAIRMEKEELETAVSLESDSDVERQEEEIDTKTNKMYPSMFCLPLPRLMKPLKLSMTVLHQRKLTKHPPPIPNLKPNHLKKYPILVHTRQNTSNYSLQESQSGSRQILYGPQIRLSQYSTTQKKQIITIPNKNQNRPLSLAIRI